MYLICCLLNFRGNVINMQFLPTKLPPVHVPQLFNKTTHIAIDENQRGNCSGLMVPTSKFWGIGSQPNAVDITFSIKSYHFKFINGNFLEGTSGICLF